MSDRPIMFSGPMVKAIIGGRKTQTRRVMKHQPTALPTVGTFQVGRGKRYRSNLPRKVVATFNEQCCVCPYGVPSDRLWVRETLRIHGHFGFPLGDHPQVREGDHARVWSYAADGVPDHTGTVVSIHMPRWASRITLEITEIRAQRLQEISEEDASSEGVERDRHGWRDYLRTKELPQASAADSFCTLWDSINTKRAPWASNPWVWVITFRKLTP